MSTDQFRLDERLAVVTGAQGKLGPVWIEALLRAGATVVGVDLPGARPSAQIAALQQQFGPRLALLPGDVCQRESLAAVRQQCLDRHGVPHVLVNNAGIDQPPGPAASYPLDEIPVEVCRQILEVNVLGAFQVTQVFGGEMARAGRGTVINIGSLYAGVSPDARLYDHIPSDPPFLKPPAYGASKAALINLTRYFAAHWGGLGVRVNALSPGGVLGGQDQEFRAKFCARVPLGRMATHDDLGGPLLFLASDASAYVTGIELKVDGGYTAW